MLEDGGGGGGGGGGEQNWGGGGPAAPGLHSDAVGFMVGGAAYATAGNKGDSSLCPFPVQPTINNTSC